MKRFFVAALAAILLVTGVGIAETTPEATPVPFVPLSEYVYAEAVSSAISLRVYYPSHWTNLPGRYTICFQEPVEEGDVPARMAVTCKQLSDKPSSDRTARELGAFLSAIVNQYDSYKVGNLTEDASFMGKDAYSSVYEATQGEKVIRGYVVMTSVGSALYGFHFCCEDKDYADMTIVLNRVRDGVSSIK